MILVDDYKNVINSMLHPTAATKKTMDIGASMVYFWKGAAIPFVLLLIEVLAIGGIVTAALSAVLSSLSTVPGLGAIITAGLAVFVIVYYLILAPIGILVDAVIFQVFGQYIFRFFKKGFKNTVSAFSYGATAAMSMIWLGPLFFLSAIWGFVVEVLALANQQSISWLKSLGTIVLTSIIIWVIVFLLRLVGL
ncbi:MAG: hypothetical protein KGH50_02560 [Candidatus Micrarchaeota archaeon]|nr:hypothetical protein [Candidatus Micrarchaeota archaeon]